jgi:hypothetical protein
LNYLGIDFSGGAGAWGPGRKNSNVWIAELVVQDIDRCRVVGLRPVQELPGDRHPFSRLASLLAERNHAAASIDAPFSIPAPHMPGTWTDLIDAVDSLPLAGRTQFPRGRALIELASSTKPFDELKPLRRTERHWQKRKLNPRSTLWWKPRGGAPFAAACMKLIAASGRPPCWPWDNRKDGILVEAYPAAQLAIWEMPFQRYSGTDGSEVRLAILKRLASTVEFGSFRSIVERSADALDAVVAAFAGIAARNRTALAPETDEATWRREGWIAVHP